MALTVVISEESGKVVVAKDSRIEEIADNVALAESLRRHLGITTESVGKNRGEKMELGAAALFSVLLITGVWFSFTRGMDTLVTLEAPVEYYNRKTTMEILDTSRQPGQPSNRRGRFPGQGHPSRTGPGAARSGRRRRRAQRLHHRS